MSGIIRRIVRAWILLGIGLVLSRPMRAGASTPPDSGEAIPGFAQLAGEVRKSCGTGGAERAALPIGVFDSGTGGLAVLNAILQVDAFDNERREPLASGDGRRDFECERFVFLADQANMPYGNYPAIGKTRYLRELVLRDAEFLMGRSYWPNANAESPQLDKRSVKAIVIACNTATAYGKSDIERLLEEAGADVPVVGVIDAGAEAAIETLGEAADATIGVMATMGTVASGAYPRAIRAIAVQRGWEDRVNVAQQGSLGLAGAIDQAREFIVVDGGESKPRGDYRGPGVGNRQAPIDVGHLARYGFD